MRTLTQNRGAPTKRASSDSGRFKQRAAKAGTGKLIEAALAEKVAGRGLRGPGGCGSHIGASPRPTALTQTIKRLGIKQIIGLKFFSPVGTDPCFTRQSHRRFASTKTTNYFENRAWPSLISFASHAKTGL